MYATRTCPPRPAGGRRADGGSTPKLLDGFGLGQGASHTEFMKAHARRAVLLHRDERPRRRGEHGRDGRARHRGEPVVRVGEARRSAAAGGYDLPPLKERYAGVVMSLARQERPDTSSFTDPEIVHRLDMKNHIGFVVAADTPERVEELLTRLHGPDRPRLPRRRAGGGHRWRTDGVDVDGLDTRSRLSVNESSPVRTPDRPGDARDAPPAGDRNRHPDAARRSSASGRRAGSWASGTSRSCARPAAVPWLIPLLPHDPDTMARDLRPARRRLPHRRRGRGPGPVRRAEAPALRHHRPGPRRRRDHAPGARDGPAPAGAGRLPRHPDPQRRLRRHALPGRDRPGAGGAEARLLPDAGRTRAGSTWPTTSR